MPVNKGRADLYTKLHKLSLVTILGASAVATGLFIYNVYLFKTRKYI
jgi:hypothetical protein